MAFSSINKSFTGHFSMKSANNLSDRYRTSYNVHNTKPYSVHLAKGTTILTERYMGNQEAIFNPFKSYVVQE